MNDFVNTVKITILVDNNASDGILAEHGLSVWIEAGRRRLLFDTGQGAVLAANVCQLGLNLALADTLILSHGHYDHTGGVPLAVDCSPDVHVYCHPGAKTPRYSIHNGNVRQIGMPETTRMAIERLLPARLHWITQAEELAPGIGITGPVPRLTAYEDVGGPFYTDRDGESRDPIEDDLALWFRTELGLVVIVGCCHSGLINTLRHAQRLSGTATIRAVIGGFHLIESNWGRVERTIAALSELEPDLIVPCHCTGDRVAEQLRQALGDRVRVGAAGETYSFE
jgi:7,8-dihydropterin-6-yl-methyl-4-(beta-D-ribofuranosyl)aminobenzene 5'-phosphate synthase